jgi:hypothetical protein
MGALSEAELAALADRYRPEVTNHRGQVVGHLEPAVELEEAVGGVD